MEMWVENRYEKMLKLGYKSNWMNITTFMIYVKIFIVSCYLPYMLQQMQNKRVVIEFFEVVGIRPDHILEVFFLLSQCSLCLLLFILF